MELFRKVRKTPQTGKSGKHSSKLISRSSKNRCVGLVPKVEVNFFQKHQELGEGWDSNREAVTEGVSFYLKYLGSTLLEELPLGESYGEGISRKAVQVIVDMAKTMNKKLVKVALKVTPHGINVVDMETKANIIDASIYRISFCTADKNHDKLFAFIARNSINETMQCHAFYCAKEKIAQAVTLSVSQAFYLARDKWEHQTNIKNNIPKPQVQEKSDESRVKEEPMLISLDPEPNITTTAPRIDPLIENHPRLPKPDTPPLGDFQSKLTKPDSQAKSERTSSPQQRQGWHTFDDTSTNICDTLDDDDDFSKLAENRSRKPSFPVSFSTDLCQEDLDDSVHDYLDGTKCLEAFSRTKSLEDLMNI